MNSRALVIATVGLALIGAQPVAAADPSGQAVVVRQDASASGTGGSRVLQVNGAVFVGDVIKTDRRGSAQLLFADNTRMVIGPRSQVTLDEFVVSSATTASRFTIDALRGSFRFITGASAKNAYTINTPTATIGVRGTEFDGKIADDGTTTISLWDGTVRVCDRDEPRRCQEITGTCSMIRLDRLKDFHRVNGVYDRTAVLDTDFPFAFRQAWLRPEWRVESSGCEVRDFSAPTSSDSNPAPVPEVIIDID